MTKADRISPRDCRRVMELVGEIRASGSDVALWHPRLITGLCALTRAQVGIGANMRNFGPGREPEGLGVYRTGWTDPKAEQAWREYASSVSIRSTAEFSMLSGFRGPIVTRTRRQLYADELWYRSRTYNDVHRRCGIDHYVFSIARLPALGGGPDLFNSVWIHRPVGDRPFGRREWWIVRTIHAEVAAQVGAALASPVEPGPTGLTARQRDVLAHLLTGQSEKQIAASLGLSPTTVHEYVAAVYRHFGATSRGELMARFVGRIPPPPDMARTRRVSSAAAAPRG